MKVLVTGAKGFVGKHISLALQAQNIEVLAYDLDTPKTFFAKYVAAADYIIHLAGINRPLTKEEFITGNVGFTSELLKECKAQKSKAPIIFSSSIQAALENDYGKSKKRAEEVLIEYGLETNNPVYIYRLENLFGKWGNPNYNSVIATWCYNISHNLELKVSDPNQKITFLYIDDVIEEFIGLIKGELRRDFKKFLSISPTYTKTLGEVKLLLESFPKVRSSLIVPNMGEPFTAKLYATYLSYLEPKDFIYPLKSHVDERGSFSEFIRSKEAGQVSVNITKPGVKKGNHYHHTKNEKFLVVYGEAKVSYRQIFSNEVITFFVSGNKLEVLDMIPGYTHSIENVGTTDLVTIMWASELYDPSRPDTYMMEVE